MERLRFSLRLTNFLCTNDDAAEKSPPSDVRPGYMSVTLIPSPFYVSHIRTLKVGKGNGEGKLVEILFEEVNLVEKEDDRHLAQKWIVNNVVKEPKRIVYSTLCKMRRVKKVKGVRTTSGCSSSLWQ